MQVRLVSKSKGLDNTRRRHIFPKDDENLVSFKTWRQIIPGPILMHFWYYILYLY